MSQIAPDLWTLALDRTAIDPADLAAALETEIMQPDLDFRTRLLIRDSINALERYWGRDHVKEWLDASPAGIDIFTGKLFSARTKDRDDLRMLAAQLDKSELAARLAESAGALLADAQLKSNAEKNWYILYGEALP